MLADCEPVSRARLRAQAGRLRAEGWRFVTASCVNRAAGWTVVYHFERDGRLRHLRLEVTNGETLPAIDASYPAAFLVENEIQELHGLPVQGMRIDYRGRLYRDFDGPEARPRGGREGGLPWRPPAAEPGRSR